MTPKPAPACSRKTRIARYSGARPRRREYAKDEVTAGSLQAMSLLALGFVPPCLSLTVTPVCPRCPKLAKSREGFKVFYMP